MRKSEDTVLLQECETITKACSDEEGWGEKASDPNIATIANAVQCHFNSKIRKKNSQNYQKKCQKIKKCKKVWKKTNYFCKNYKIVEDVKKKTKKLVTNIHS